MKYKSIFFDLDGTLTDSGEGILNCAALALEHFGVPVPTPQEMRVFVGPPLRKTFAQFGIPDDGIETAMKIYRSRYNTVGLFENSPYPGIRKLLERLKADGYRLFVATAKPEDIAVRVLERFDLAKYFEIICGASNDKSRDTKEAVIACLQEQIHGQGDTVMIGDTAYDVLGAKAHGIPTIGVAWGYGKVEDMTAAGAVAIAQDTKELYRLLK